MRVALRVLTLMVAASAVLGAVVICVPGLVARLVGRDWKLVGWCLLGIAMGASGMAFWVTELLSVMR